MLTDTDRDEELFPGAKASQKPVGADLLGRTRTSTWPKEYLAFHKALTQAPFLQQHGYSALDVK